MPPSAEGENSRALSSRTPTPAPPPNEPVNWFCFSIVGGPLENLGGAVALSPSDRSMKSCGPSPSLPTPTLVPGGSRGMGHKVGFVWGGGGPGICSCCSPRVIKAGLPKSSFMTLLPPRGFRDSQEQREQETEPGSAVFWCASLPPLHFNLLEGRGTRPSRALLFPSPAEPLPSPASSRWCPGSRCQPC